MPIIVQNVPVRTLLGGDVFRNAMLSYVTKCVHQRKLFDGSRQKGLVFFNNDCVHLCRLCFLGLKFWCSWTNNKSFFLPQKRSDTCNNWKRPSPQRRTLWMVIVLMNSSHSPPTSDKMDTKTKVRCGSYKNVGKVFIEGYLNYIEWQGEHFLLQRFN